MAFRFAICAHKGGTGKTVTSLALAAGLANAGRRVLLVDLDPQGHCSLGLGVDVDRPTLKEFFEAHPTRPLTDVIQETSSANLDIAPSDLALSWVAEGLGSRPKKEELLHRSCKQIDDRYDVLVIDTPPSLGVLTQNAVTAAEFILIPALQEARAGEAIQDLLELVTLMKGDGFDSYRIVFTRVDGRKTKTMAAVRQALQPWQDRILQTEIPQAEALNQAQMAQEDIFTFADRSPGAQAYYRLINEILTITKQ